MKEADECENKWQNKEALFFLQIEVSIPNTQLQNSGGPQIFNVTA